MTADEARKLALALPETTEQDHHGRPSFRVAGKIFATLWDAEHMNVMVDEPGIRTAVQARPEVCAEVWWGKRLSAVRVTLPAADHALLSEILADAWEGRAPARARTEAPRAGANQGGSRPSR
jgi:hypothetical protein